MLKNYTVKRKQDAINNKIQIVVKKISWASDYDKIAKQKRRNFKCG